MRAGETGIPRDDECWFCIGKRNPSSESAAIRVALHRDGVAPGGKLYVEQTVVTIPRCKKCQTAHSIESLLKGIGLAVGFVLGTVVILALTPLKPIRGTAMLTILLILAPFAGGGWGAGWILGRLFCSKKVQDVGNARSHPQVRELVSRQWTVGEPPPAR